MERVEISTIKITVLSMKEVIRMSYFLNFRLNSCRSSRVNLAKKWEYLETSRKQWISRHHLNIDNNNNIFFCGETLKILRSLKCHTPYFHKHKSPNGTTTLKRALVGRHLRKWDIVVLILWSLIRGGGITVETDS